MSLSRRRFIAISAAAMAVPGAAEPAVWRGRALGADVSLQVAGLDRDAGARLWRRVRTELDRVEQGFSLFRPSELTRLNASGFVAHPSGAMRALIALAGELHRATEGAFDPTVQPIWQALAEGRDAEKVRPLTGWHRVETAGGAIRLRPGMALTFNGIAQGHAADRVAALMRHEGLGDVLIDMGEIVALGERAPGRPWQVGIAAPGGAVQAVSGLRDRALATSSPGATRIGPARAAHILHPSGQPPLWQTVSVSAPDAALADGLSTAFCLMDADAIARALKAFPGARLEHLT